MDMFFASLELMDYVWCFIVRWYYLRYCSGFNW